MTNTPPLSELKRVPMRKAWRHESTDFTPWLATDGDQKVAIENHFEETDHKHLVQILAYAAEVQSHA